jgi:hypothetical protein
MRNKKHRILTEKIREMSNWQLLEFRREYEFEKQFINPKIREILEKAMDDREKELK